MHYLTPQYLKAPYARSFRTLQQQLKASVHIRNTLGTPVEECIPIKILKPRMHADFFGTPLQIAKSTRPIYTHTHTHLYRYRVAAWHFRLYLHILEPPFKLLSRRDLKCTKTCVCVRIPTHTNTQTQRDHSHRHSIETDTDTGTDADADADTLTKHRH